MRVITPEKMYLVEPNSSSRPFEKQKCITLVEKTIVSFLKGKSLDENGNRRKFIYEYATGGKYDGAWCVGKPDGQGTFQYPNGNIYLGNFELGRRSGAGKMVYNKNGGIYDGDWLLDKPRLFSIFFNFFIFFYFSFFKILFQFFNIFFFPFGIFDSFF